MSMHRCDHTHGTGVYVIFSFSLVCVFTSPLATEPLEIPLMAQPGSFLFFSTNIHINLHRHACLCKFPYTHLPTQIYYAHTVAVGNCFIELYDILFLASCFPDSTIPWGNLPASPGTTLMNCAQQHVPRPGVMESHACTRLRGKTSRGNQRRTVLHFDP